MAMSLVAVAVRRAIVITPEEASTRAPDPQCVELPFFALVGLFFGDSVFFMATTDEATIGWDRHRACREPVCDLPLEDRRIATERLPSSLGAGGTRRSLASADTQPLFSARRRGQSEVLPEIV